METPQAASALLNYLESLDGFRFLDYHDGNYGHIGATISDAILQAGLNYDSVVRPRIRKILATYPVAKTTSGFLALLNKVGAKAVLDWSDDEKPTRVAGLAEFFRRRNIETEQDLREWLSDEANRPALLGRTLTL